MSELSRPSGSALGGGELLASTRPLNRHIPSPAEYDRTSSYLPHPDISWRTPPSPSYALLLEDGVDTLFQSARALEEFQSLENGRGSDLASLDNGPPQGEGGLGGKTRGSGGDLHSDLRRIKNPPRSKNGRNLTQDARDQLNTKDPHSSAPSYASPDPSLYAVSEASKPHWSFSYLQPSYGAPTREPELHRHMSSVAQQHSTYDLEDPTTTHPYPFSTSHSSTLSASLPQPHHQVPSQQQPSYTHVPDRYDDQGHQIQGPSTKRLRQQLSALGSHHARASMTVPYSGSTLWNAMARPSNEDSSRHRRSSDALPSYLDTQ